MEETEGKEEFKISDKRRFTVEGEERESEEAAPSTSEDKVAQDAEPAAQEGEAKQKPDPAADSPKTDEAPPPPLDFSGFTLSLANTVLFQLGLIKMSENDEPRRDLAAARQTIDLMSLLEEKTRGNLTDDEKKLLTETLFQLRMAFVEASK
jgi:hypothetical protein